LTIFDLSQECFPFYKVGVFYTGQHTTSPHIS
jgi:hypothetical protein